ncbi:MAG: hypothetical protein AAFR11_10815 [Pseudomonadota bacterium]
MDGIFSGEGLFGFGGVVAESFFWGHVAIAGASAMMFIASFGFCAAAFRAVQDAKSARADAEAHKRSAQDLAVEVRHLTAQVERALARAEGGVADPGRTSRSHPVRVGATRDTEEAEVEIIASNDGEKGAAQAS